MIDRDRPREEDMMRALKLFTAVAVSAVMAGCASTRAAGPSRLRAEHAGRRAGPGGRSGDGRYSPAASPGGPSASALMVCSSEIKKDVATVLGLPSTPATTSTWTDHLYTCTYHLASGTLVLSVKESADTPSANAYFTALQQHLGTTTPLTGAQGLGNPGYQSPSGAVVILKDDKTLHVDATALPPASGASNLSRADVAYEIATDVIGCWSGD